MPIESAPLQKLARGLLGFFDLKNGGKNPQSLGTNQLTCVADLTPWYLETNADELSAVFGGIVAPGTSLIGTVPPDEYWYVFQLSGTATLLGAGEAALIAPTMLTPQALAAVVLGQAVVGGPVQDALTFADKPFFAPPGAQLGIRYTGTIIGFDLSIVCRFARLPI